MEIPLKKIHHLFGTTYSNPDLPLKEFQKILHQELDRALRVYIEAWSKRLNVEVLSFKIRRMKSKWGSCHILKKHIVFNLELGKYSPRCIEYVVAHELIHLIEPSHNARFKMLMTEAIPEWKALKKDLTQFL